MNDIVDKMLDAYDTEWLLWSVEPVEKDTAMPRCAVKRGDLVVREGGFHEAQASYEKLSSRAGMMAAIKVLQEADPTCRMVDYATEALIEARSCHIAKEQHAIDIAQAYLHGLTLVGV